MSKLQWLEAGKHIYETGCDHGVLFLQNADGSFALTKWNSLTVDIRSEGMREYLYTNMVYYIAQIGVDGFRCDVGDMLPVYFWREARRRIQAIKRDAVLVNESKSINTGFLCHPNYRGNF